MYLYLCICVFVYLCICVTNPAPLRLIDSGLYSCQPSVGDLKSVTVHVIRSETTISFFPSYCLPPKKLLIKSIWPDIFCDCKGITYFRTLHFLWARKFVDFESFATSIFIGKCKYFVLMQLFPPVNLSRPYHTFWRKTCFQKIKWAA